MVSVQRLFGVQVLLDVIVPAALPPFGVDFHDTICKTKTNHIYFKRASIRGENWMLGCFLMSRKLNVLLLSSTIAVRVLYIVDCIFKPKAQSTCIGIFLKTEIFSLGLQTNTRPNVAYSNPFRPFTSIKTPKRQIYDSIPLRACVMLVVYDAWHDRIRKPPFSSVHA